MPQSVAEKVAKLCGTSFCAKRGRPRAEDRSLADFVCEGVDADALRQEFLRRLKVYDGTARQLALIEKELIDDKKLKHPIPYKLMKVEFGKLIKVSRQVLNRHEAALKLRS